MYRAFTVGVLISLCASLLGVILVLKRCTLIGHGLGEVGFCASALAVCIGISPMALAIPMVVAASFIVMVISQKGSGDVAIGVMATAALSVGVMLTSLSSGSNIDVKSYMFGSILSVNESDMLLSILLSCAVIILFILLFNRLFAVSYDEGFARACGINVTMYRFIIAFLTAVTVVLGMRMMGSMLISSLIIFPALGARRLGAGFKGMVILSALISVICFAVGFMLSFLFDLPTGACVVCVDLLAMLLCFVFGKKRT